jgi:hypothetical protein
MSAEFWWLIIPELAGLVVLFFYFLPRFVRWVFRR